LYQTWKDKLGREKRSYLLRGGFRLLGSGVIIKLNDIDGHMIVLNLLSGNPNGYGFSLDAVRELR
jgi:hypothetical protein